MPIYILMTPSQRETLYGLHQQHFDTLYFTQILMTIGPGQTAARGTVPSLPIPFNDISSFTFITFVFLLYQPNNFQTHTQGWKNIEKLADKWGCHHITIRAMEKLWELDQLCYGDAPHHCILQLPAQTRLVAKQTDLRWKFQHQRWDYESVEDDSS